MSQGHMLMRIEPSKKYPAKDVYVFRDSEKLHDTIREYQQRTSKQGENNE